MDILKIDKSFVIGLGTRGSDATRRQMAMIRAASSLAQELGITVVAEGIEAVTSTQILMECGVQFGQGYLFSRPMPAASFKEWHLEASRSGSPAVQSPLHAGSSHGKPRLRTR